MMQQHSLEDAFSRKDVRARLEKIVGRPIIAPVFTALKTGLGFHVSVRDKTNYVIAEFSVSQQQNCCGVCYYTGKYVDHKEYNKGISALMQEWIEKAASCDGYGVLMCYTVPSFEENMLITRGYSPLYKFTNPRTQRTISVWLKEIKL